MDLNTIALLMFAFLFAGYLVLEGFGYGIGMLLPFLGKSDRERRAIIATLAPVWEGNEVWLIAAGTVLFAAFPHVYATLFSGLYLPLLLILATLILRGVAFEFRDRVDGRRWRAIWDGAIFAGGLVPAVLWGVAIASLAGGLPVDGNRQYAGAPTAVLSPYTLTGGLALAALFLLHGAAYLTLKLDRPRRTVKAGLRAGKYALFALVAFAVLTFAYTDLAARPLAGGLLAAAVVAAAFACRCLAGGRCLAAFAASALAIVALAGAVFGGLYPRLLVSSLDPAWSLTVYNAASNQLTLKIMAVTMAVVLPAVLVFEGWKYRVFRQRISVAALDFAPRRKLWRQLRGRLAALSCHGRRLGAAVEKAARAAAAREAAAQAIADRTAALRTHIQRGRRLADSLAALLKTLRRQTRKR